MSSLSEKSGFSGIIEYQPMDGTGFKFSPVHIHCGGTRGVQSQQFNEYMPFTGTTVQYKIISTFFMHPRETDTKPKVVKFGQTLVEVLMILYTFNQYSLRLQV